jgi:RHS repeat-associated protein
MTHMSGVDTLNYQYDAMSRLVGMTDANNATVATAQYDGNSQLSQLDWGGLREVRQYNQLQQMTRITTTKPLEGTTWMDMQYIYVAGANNGRVTQTIDGVTGDTQAFGYDALNRLVSVTSSLGNNESMAYDGFGNLTSMNGVSYTVDPTTNRRTGGTDIMINGYTANGVVTSTWATAGGGSWQFLAWDVENRLASVQNGSPAYTETMVYDPWGKRVAVTESGSTQVYFYSLSGQRLTGPNGVNRYFGGKLLQSNGVGVATDRLGSVRANGNGDRMVYKAYGTERTSTADGREKFGTYFRDGTGLDYAEQRYYGHEGMFLSPDPGGVRTADATDPESWNRYGYANGDPVNFNDPAGKFACVVGVGEGAEITNCEVITMYVDSGVADTTGTAVAPGPSVVVQNKGGWYTNPAGTGKTAWQYLSSIWSNCLNDFNQDTRFDASTFQSLLNSGITWLDSRAPSVGDATVDSYAHNGDTTTLSQLVAAGDSAVTIPGTQIVVLGANYFTDNTQTEQIGIAVHEALHIALGFNDAELAGWLENFGFKPSGPDWNSHEMTDWIVGTADHMSTTGGGCKKP